MTSTSTEVRPTDLVETVSTDDPANAAHIVFVPPESGMTPQALVVAAQVEGFPVEAMCGWTWVPSKNPRNLPICQPCLDAYHAPGDNRDDRNDLPDA